MRELAEEVTKDTPPLDDELSDKFMEILETLASRGTNPVDESEREALLAIRREYKRRLIDIEKSIYWLNGKN